MAEFYFRAPRWAHLPHLHTILDSIGNDRAVARKLGLAESTIRKYRKEGQAPKPVMYALFWETPWGRSTADASAINDARFAHMRSMTLERENRILRDQVEALEKRLSEGLQVAANHDFFMVGSR